jgi:hypothetical protein
MNDIIHLPDLRVARYRFTLNMLEPVYLPPYKGSALRGGFGHTLKQLVCYQPTACGEHCRLGNDCVYGYLFETAPPEGAEVLRNLSEVARPFVVEPPLDRRPAFEPGERLDFYVVLIGRGIGYLPYFVLVFQQLGQAGLGRTRGKFALERVMALDGRDGKEGKEGREGKEEVVFDAADGMMRTCDLSVGPAEWEAQAAAFPCPPLPLTFLTPTRLKHEGRLVDGGPPFHVLIKALLGRVSSLSYFHCGQRWDTDFRGWIDRAQDVRLVDAGTGWVDWERYSGRQQQRVRMGGLVGRATYEGDLHPYLPLLALGELVHVGKGTVFGNGWIRVQSSEAAAAHFQGTWPGLT